MAEQCAGCGAADSGNRTMAGTHVIYECGAVKGLTSRPQECWSRQVRQVQAERDSAREALEHLTSLIVQCLRRALGRKRADNLLLTAAGVLEKKDALAATEKPL